MFIVLYPDRQYSIDESPEAQSTGSVSTDSLTVMGKNIFKLQKSLFMLEVGSKVRDIDDVMSVFDDKLFSRLDQPKTLNKFLNERGFKKHVRSGLAGEVSDQTAVKALYLLVGCVAYVHGKPAASEFVTEAIFRRRGGLFDISMKA